jgi:hypothetical protein
MGVYCRNVIVRNPSASSQSKLYFSTNNITRHLAPSKSIHRRLRAGKVLENPRRNLPRLQPPTAPLFHCSQPQGALGTTQ